jgi:iron complex transport system permease protein
VVGYLTIATMLPYLVLKTLWLSGNHVGILDAQIAHDPSLLALNAVTFGMDVVAVVIVLAFTHGWGLRAPAALVALPLWVGTGLLVPVALTMPVSWLAMLSSPAAGTGTDFLASWVRPMVYGGFTGQAVGLSVAFVLYARARWSSLFTRRVGDRTPGVTHPVQVLGAVVAAVLVAFVGLFRLLWASGAGFGLPDGYAAQSSFDDLWAHGVFAVAVIGAAVGLLTMVLRWARRTPFWVPLVVVWAGSGAMLAWGLWSMLNLLGGTALSADTFEANLLTATEFVQVLAGMLIAVVGTLVVVEMQAAGSARGLAVDGSSMQRDRDRGEDQHRQHATAYEGGGVLREHGAVATADLGQRHHEGQRGRAAQCQLEPLAPVEHTPVHDQHR